MKNLFFACLMFFSMNALAQKEQQQISPYDQAFLEINAMLSGEQEPSFKRAVFVSENAFFDQALKYEQFQEEINKLRLLAKMVQSSDRLDYHGQDRDKVLKYWSAYSILKDTVRFEVTTTNPPTYIETEPYSYDFDDFFGEKDWSKMFVTKLLATHKGNCHSLPYLYKILVEEMGEEAHLSMAPNHTYIKQWTENTGWFNTELTSGQFPLDAWIMASGYIKLEAIQNRLYMEALDTKQSIAVTLVDLAQGYQKKYGKEANPDFVLACLNTALKHYPNYAHAKILKAETFKAQYVNMMQKYQTTEPSQLWEIPDAKRLFEIMQSQYQTIYKEGYRKMPREMYLNWLTDIQQDQKNKDLGKFTFKAPQPFKEYGYEVPTATLSKGKYQEFFDQDTIIQVGTVMMNRLTGKVTAFIEYDTVYSEATLEPEVISKFLSPDPRADERESLTPYNFVQNNPINRVDPDGALDYPIIRITKQRTGETVDQAVLGYSGGVITQADLYKVVVTDTEDADFRMEFSITRDAWAVEAPGDNVAQNVAFEPKDGDVNHFTGKVMKGGYPRGNGTESLKLTQYGSEVMHAQASEASVSLGYRTKSDVAAGIMIHVGGNYVKNGKNRIAASEGCFGVCNTNNSASNPSNGFSNQVMTQIQQQANKSQTNPGHIRVIIEKREGNEFPKTKEIR